MRLMILLLALCVMVSVFSLAIGLDAHYDVRCLRYGFNDARIAWGGVTCRDRTGLEVWLRDLENIRYGVPDGKGL